MAMQALCATVFIIMGIICLIAICLGGNLPEIPLILFVGSGAVGYIYDSIEEIKEYNEKRRKKASKRGLISL